MFLLVSGRHVGAHTDGHQHDISIQISINLGKKFLHVSRIRKIAVTRILARVFVYLLSFDSQILDFIYWPVLIFILIYFELRDTENQQLTMVCFTTTERRMLLYLRSLVHNATPLWMDSKVSSVTMLWQTVTQQNWAIAWPNVSIIFS